MSQKQRDILIGLLLGDGHLETQNNGRTYRLKIEHSMEQADYVLWIYEEFKDFVNKKPYTKVRKNGQRSFGFNTLSMASLRFYGKSFYPKGKKIIPEMMLKKLKPISLAVWFMDDGSRKSLKHKTYIIHTLGFRKTEVSLLKKYLKIKFNIDTELHLQKGKFYRLYVNSISAKQFTNLIYPFVSKIKSMKHKIVLDWIT